MHGSGITGLGIAAAALKMNDDGSFNLLIGATNNLGTGSDTILAQMAAEVVGIYLKISSCISGGAARKATMQIRDQILDHAALKLEASDPKNLVLKDRKVIAPSARSVTLAEVALDSLHQQDQH